MSLKIIFFNFIITLVFLNIPDLVAQTDTITGIGTVSPTLDTTSKTSCYIPADMKECLKELDAMLPESVKDSMEILDLVMSQKKYGMLVEWMVRKWEMFDTSRIVKYFTQFGYEDPSEIGPGIFRSYWNYLNDKPIRIEINPKYYSLGNNLFIKTAINSQIPESATDPKGRIVLKNSKPQFLFMEMNLTLFDSLYQPIINLITEKGFNPSDSLWYIWWPQLAKFGDGVEGLPDFLTEEEFEQSYSYNKSYIADFILIIEDGDISKMSYFHEQNKFDEEFKDYLKTKKHFGFYLFKQREVYKYD